MKLKFIGHAGFAVKTEQTTIMLDPWFFSSDFENPILHGICAPFKTIDFMIPEVRDSITNFHPDAILISHFHTHHSPRREIKTLLRQKKCEDRVFFGTPQIENRARRSIMRSLQEESELFTIRSLAGRKSTWQVGDCKVTAFKITSQQHCAWLIQSPQGSFLHVSDGAASRNNKHSELDAVWYLMADLAPDFMAVSCAGHCNRKRDSSGRVWIEENTSLSPVQAAQLVALIKPKSASVMGIYNHSIWSQRIESSLPAGYVEQEFRWACQWLRPEMTTRILSPGEEFQLQGSEAKTDRSRPVSLRGSDFFDGKTQPIVEIEYVKASG